MSQPANLTLTQEQVGQLYDDLVVLLETNDAAVNLGMRDPAFNAFVRFLDQAKRKSEPMPASELLHMVFSICDIHSTQAGWQHQLNDELRNRVKWLSGRVEELEVGRE